MNLNKRSRKSRWVIQCSFPLFYAHFVLLNASKVYNSSWCKDVKSNVIQGFLHEEARFCSRKLDIIAQKFIGRGVRRRALKLALFCPSMENSWVIFLWHYCSRTRSHFPTFWLKQLQMSIANTGLFLKASLFCNKTLAPLQIHETTVGYSSEDGPPRKRLTLFLRTVIVGCCGKLT